MGRKKCEAEIRQSASYGNKTNNHLIVKVVIFLAVGSNNLLRDV
jgi:hypothetical protein